VDSLPCDPAFAGKPVQGQAEKAIGFKLCPSSSDDGSTLAIGERKSSPQRIGALAKGGAF